MTLLIAILVSASLGLSQTVTVDMTNMLVMIDQTTCPTGWTDVTATFQGRYLTAKAATGLAGDTLGTAIATTTTDSSFTPAGTVAAPVITCTATSLFVATAGTEPACDNSPAPTNAAPVFTGDAVATMRSTIAPAVAMRLCRKV